MRVVREVGVGNRVMKAGNNCSDRLRCYLVEGIAKKDDDDEERD